LNNPQLTLAEAEKAIADGQKAVEEAQRRLRNTQSPASQGSIDEAQAQVTIAKDRLDKAKDKYAPYANKPESNLTRANLLSQMAQAQQAYDAAVRNLNSLQGTAGATDQAIAQANLEAAQAQLADSQRAWERLKDGPSQAEIALAEANLADAQRNWERLKDGPDPEEVAAAEARILAAQSALSQMHLTAPFEGVITQVFNKPGDQVSPSSPAFRLDDLSRLLVDVQVSEVDINQVQVGQVVALTFDSILGKEFHGQVLEVATVGEQVQGVVNFTVTVELTGAGEGGSGGGAVKPGMTASVTITVSELSDVLLVPNRAVRIVEGQRVVYVMRNGASTAVPVTLGRSSDLHSEVLDGEIQAGDQIVLNPQSELDQFGPGAQGNNGGGPFGPGGGQ
jgi:HlyD family secretion protein